MKEKKKDKINGTQIYYLKYNLGLPGGTVVQNPPANAGDTSLIPAPGRSHMPQNNYHLCATTTKPILWSPQAVTTVPPCATIEAHVA